MMPIIHHACVMVTYSHIIPEQVLYKPNEICSWKAESFYSLRWLPGMEWLPISIRILEIRWDICLALITCQEPVFSNILSILRKLDEQMNFFSIF